MQITSKQAKKILGFHQLLPKVADKKSARVIRVFRENGDIHAQAVTPAANLHLVFPGDGKTSQDDEGFTILVEDLKELAALDIQIHIEQEPGSHVLQVAGPNKTGQVDIKTIPREDFQFPQNTADWMPFPIDPETFRIAMESLEFSIPNDDSRPGINGVLVDPEGENLHLVSTDAYRITRVTVPNTQILETEFFIPATAIRMVQKTTGHSIKWSSQGILIEVPGPDFHVTFFARTPLNPFPAYRELFQRTFPWEFQANLPDFQAACRTLEIIAKGTFIAPISISRNSTGIAAETFQKNKGRAFYHISGQGANFPFEIGFNPIFLAQAIDHLEGEETTILFAGDNQPILFRKKTGVADWEHLLMPVRLTA